MITKADIRTWQADLRAEGLSPRTIRNYETSAQQYLALSGGAVDRASVREYQVWLSERGLTPGTQTVRLTGLRSFMRWLVSEEIIEADPMKGIKAPKTRVVPITPFTRSETTAIIKAAVSYRDKAIVTLLRDTGMRVGELAGILRENLNYGQQFVLVMGKGSKPRVIPFSDQASGALGRYLRREREKSRFADLPELWLSERGAASAACVAHVVRGACRRAGITGGINPHRFRHTFANDWLASSGSEQGLMAIAGWSSRSMLDRYSAHGRADRAMAEYRRLRG